jgi:hypothetical protein
MLWESCSSSYTKHNKIEFAIFGFLSDFLRFFKVAAKTHKRCEIHFANRPLESFGCSQSCPWFTIRPPGKNSEQQCSPGAWGGAAGRIPATSPTALVGEVAGEGLGVTREQFVCLHAEGRGPAGGHGGDRWRRPLEWLLRRAGGSAWPTSEGGTYVGARGRREQHVLAVKSGRRWISPWAQMAAAMAARWLCNTRDGRRRPFYSQASSRWGR